MWVPNYSTQEMGKGQGQDRSTGRWIRNVSGAAGDIKMRIFDRCFRLETMLVQTGGKHHECSGTLEMEEDENIIKYSSMSLFGMDN